MEVVMQQNSINSQFQSYSNTLYAAASRMLDKRNPQHEDKVQDLVILAYEEFKRKADQGVIMSLPLLIHFMKLRKPEVQLEMRGASRTHKKDVFNKRNYYEGKLELYSIDNPLNKESGETFAESIEDENNLEEEILFRLEYQDRLAMLHINEQTILQMKMNGYQDYEIAQTMCIQSSTVKTALQTIAPKMMEMKTVQCELQL
jgi:DNA-directed RNA polymerase specialized sigma24 family protein